MQRHFFAYDRSCLTGFDKHANLKRNIYGIKEEKVEHTHKRA